MLYHLALNWSNNKYLKRVIYSENSKIIYIFKYYNNMMMISYRFFKGIHYLHFEKNFSLHKNNGIQISVIFLLFFIAITHSTNHTHTINRPKFRKGKK